ncbi:alpha/beta hydrolase [Shewanella sp. OPT22]|nr:alpha/beta hydrolase [Shewanella sp. OPT22]
MKKLIFLVLLCTSFFNYADEHEYSYVDVGENKLAYLCKGEGELTALMIAGMGLNAHDTYKNTFHNAEPEGFKLCLFDRAGTGKSYAKQRKVRSISELAVEMEAFAEKAGFKQLILVPHSFGGFVARAYAHRNPDSVKAILFVDAAHESWYQDMKESMSAKAWKTMDWIMDWEKTTNSLEDFAEASSHSKIYELKPETEVVVLSRGIPHVSIRQTGMAYKDVDAYDNSWNRSQEKLKMVSQNVTYEKMKYASHLFDQTDPWIVLEHIDRLAKSKIK